MTDNVIDFARYKKDADHEKSEHIGTLDLYRNHESGEVWAAVSNVDHESIDAEWNTAIADHLRQLAWLADCEAAKLSGDGEPVASVSIFDDRRISTRWNDDLIFNEAQVDWVREQLSHGADEIDVTPPRRRMI